LFLSTDVLGSAKGWAANLILHPSVNAQFGSFRARPDTFSLGVCNGCQLMGLADWVVSPPAGQTGDNNLDSLIPAFFTDHNTSGRFESRFSWVKIEEDGGGSGSVFFKGLGGCVLGVWVAHGEGKFVFRDEETRQEMGKLVALRYCDDRGNPTEEYPLNPNGSPGNVQTFRLFRVQIVMILGLRQFSRITKNVSRNPRAFNLNFSPFTSAL
jgi:phosphoribosylformylglycinamidine synthase